MVNTTPISDYYRQLRQKVGHELLLAPAAAAIIFDAHGRVLLGKHNETGTWLLPGGVIEPDEHPADAIVREIWEETGLLVEPTRLLGMYGGPEFRVTYRNGDKIAFLSSVFECQVLEGDMRPDGTEIAGLQYFSQDDLAALHESGWMQIVLSHVFQKNKHVHFRTPIWTPSETDFSDRGMSDYIRTLRSKIGHDLLVMPAAGVIIFDEQGRMLLQQRSDNGEWHPPAGAVEPDESPSDTVVREVWEETGLIIEPVRLIGIYNGPEFHATYPHGDQIAAFSTIFEGRVVGGQLRPDGSEVAALHYFSPNELTDELIPKRWRRRVQDGLLQDGSTYFEPATWRPS